jgi:hypothetical protein
MKIIVAFRNFANAPKNVCVVPTAVMLLCSNIKRTNQLNVACFLLGNSSAPECYMPTFRNTLFHLHRRLGMKNSSYLPAYEDGTDRVFRKVGI